ncbi:MAG: hypothetical protein KUG61_10410 [Parvibaculaceae bacterium]|nr:hypothetical protein [Parvibaculaceae bacterium]
MNGSGQLVAAILAGFVGNGQPAEAPLITGSILQQGSRQKPHIIDISEASCQFLADHMTRPDVAYQPGVSVNGAPVVSASVDGSLTDLTTAHFLSPIYEFDVVFSPMSGRPSLERSEFVATTVTFDPQRGEVTLNGESRIWLHRAALAKACAKRHGRR